MNNKLRDEIIRTYGDENGYIFCANCPLDNECTSGECDHSGCDGYDIAYTRIQNFLTTSYGPWLGEITSEENPSKNDMVNHPKHYTSSGIECIDAIEAALSSYSDPKDAFLVGQVIKYLWRAPLKGTYEQDIKKAQWYLNKLVDHQNKEDAKNDG